MNIQECEIPYAERHLMTDSGFALIWPFLNVPRGNGPYELFLDTNALSKTRWASELPSAIRERTILNPWPAMMEQWFSNAIFREDPVGKIESLIAPLQALGFRFRDGFAEQQATLLRLNEAQLRTQCSLLFPYIAIAKSLLREKIAPDAAFSRLKELTHLDVPRFTGCLMLMALSVLLKGRQSLKLDGDSKPAYSYLDSFLDFHSGKKDETNHITVPYLRNRSGDLSLWYMLPMLMQHGYSLAGEPVVVTADKALHRLIFRLLPPVLHPNTTAFAVARGEIEEALSQSINEIVSGVEVRPNPTLADRARRMRLQFDLAAQQCTHPEEGRALMDAWETWHQPGMGLAMRFS